MKAGALAALAATALLSFTLAPSRRSGDPALVRLAAYDFEDGSAVGWAPDDPSHWRVVAEDGSRIYELTAPGAPGPVRAPASRSVLVGRDVSSFEFSGRLRCHTDPTNPFRDMCVIFHFQDPTHFCYVHFAGKSDDVHNIIGLVDGADRVKINAEPAGASVFRLTDLAWHAFKVTCDARTGEIRAYLDDMAVPILTARAAVPGHGRVGVGSFDDTGAFDDIELRAPKE